MDFVLGCVGELVFVLQLFAKNPVPLTRKSALSCSVSKSGLRVRATCANWSFIRWEVSSPRLSRPCSTADADDRVVPAHTFKYVAALQAANLGSKPHLVRIETRAGYGGGAPLDKVIAQHADMWAFAAYRTGLKVGKAE